MNNIYPESSNTSPLNNFIDNTRNSISNLSNTVSDTVSSNVSNISNTVASNVNSISDSVASNINTPIDAPSDFSYSNTLIAKFAFLILVVIVFLFLLNLGITMIQYFTSPSTSPTLIDGMIDGNVPLTIPQDPSNSDSKLILRSNNESEGLEFTWSTWIYINELSDESTIYQHIFNKGDTKFNNIGIASVNNAPGLYLKSKESNGVNTAKLHVVMDSNNSYDTTNYINIDDVPIKKWVNVIIRMQNTILDVYINGIVSGRLIMKDVPKQNYNNVNINQNRGFLGKISNLKYYNRALNIFEINSIIKNGPNLNQYQTMTVPTDFTYLSQLWYSSKL